MTRVTVAVREGALTYRELVLPRLQGHVVAPGTSDPYIRDVSRHITVERLDLSGVAEP